jgi:hypothetical protein
MTAEAFAALVEQARSTGSGRWQARCPSHSDTTPSLSVAAGRDGRVLLHCHAGCSLDAILAALKLERRDLYAGPRPSPTEQVALDMVRQERARRARAEGDERRAAFDRARRWEAIVHQLGAKLARDPADDGLARAFHEACEKHRGAEVDAARRARRIAPKGGPEDE